MTCANLRKALTCIETRHIQILLLLIATISLATAYIAEYGYKILPCDFCLYERGVYAAIILTSILSLLKVPFLKGRGGIVVQLLILSIGIAVTFFHVGMELHWWSGPASCSGGGKAATFEEFRANLVNKPRPRCDQPSWIIFSVSATAWNLVLQGGLAFLLSLTFYLPLGNSLKSKSFCQDNEK